MSRKACVAPPGSVRHRKIAGAALRPFRDTRPLLQTNRAYQGCLCAACQFSLPAPTSVSDPSILDQRRRPPSTYGAVSSHAPKGPRANDTGIIGPKQMWEPACRRCAARAALGLTGAAFLSPYKWQPSRDPTAAPTNPIIRSMLRQQTSKDRIRAARCLPWFLRCCADRAPPALRFASCARSYVCFGPIMPGGFARERFGARLDMATYKQGGRARLAQDGLAGNKRRSGFSRDAPRERRSVSQALHSFRHTNGGPHATHASPTNPTITSMLVAAPHPGQHWPAASSASHDPTTKVLTQSGATAAQSC